MFTSIQKITVDVRCIGIKTTERMYCATGETSLIVKMSRKLNRGNAM